MKVLLTAINAKYIHSNPGIYSLYHYAKPYQSAIEIAEYTINHTLDDIVSGIYKAHAEVIVFSCYIWNIQMVLEAAQILKAADPKLQIWLGGPEVSFDCEDRLMQCPYVDGIMRGEGEAVFCQLMRYFLGEGVTLSEIGSLTYREGDAIRMTKDAPLMDMDALPFIYEDMSLYDHKIIYYESSRGCPYACSYCLSSVDKTVRFKSIELVRAELQQFIDARVPQVKFVDRTFNCRHSHTRDVWTYIRDHDNGVTNFHFEITADLLNDEEIDLLASMRPGLVQLEIGVQSTCPETIEAIHRKVEFAKLKTVVDRIHAAGNVHQHLDLIAGLPYEDLERFKQSFDDVYRLYPEQLQLGFLKVLKGSYMHRAAASYGLIYRNQPPYEVIATRWLSFEDVLYLKDIENVLELFYNSHQFEMTIRYLEHRFERPFELYAALAECFERYGYKGMGASRITRCMQLLTFAHDLGADEDLVKELLTYDLYAREALKSRPDWIRKLDPFKQEVAAFYSDPANIEQYFYEFKEDSYRTLRHFSHMEPFEHDVFASAKSGQPVTAHCYLLFDYRKKNPLTQEAEVTMLHRG